MTVDVGGVRWHKEAFMGKILNYIDPYVSYKFIMWSTSRYIMCGSCGDDQAGAKESKCAIN